MADNLAQLLFLLYNHRLIIRIIIATILQLNLPIRTFPLLRKLMHFLLRGIYLFVYVIKICQHVALSSGGVQFCPLGYLIEAHVLLFDLIGEG